MMWTATATLCLILALFVAFGMAVCLATPARLQHNGVTPSRAAIGASFSVFLVILLSVSFVSAMQSLRTKAHSHADPFSLLTKSATDDAASHRALNEAAQSCSQSVALIGLAVDQNDTVDVSGAGLDARHDCAVTQQKILNVHHQKEGKDYNACLEMAKLGQLAGAQGVELGDADESAKDEALLRQTMNHFTWLSLQCAASAYPVSLSAG